MTFTVRSARPIGTVMHLRTRTATVAALLAGLACLSSPPATAAPADAPRAVEVALPRTAAAPATSQGAATDAVVVADMDVLVPQDIAQEPTPTPTAASLDVPPVSATDDTVVADVAIADGRTAT
ncbi:MAG: hypothetical protein HGA44_17425, partial [Cellulomonadaceae bacterium]|nr:hypothetical protein [Cellulomonadaceae bacterium]